MIKKYRKKPVVIEAIQYKKDKIHEVMDFFNEDNVPYHARWLKYDEGLNEYYIETLEGNMYLTEGDYIIKGVEGEFYPCKPDIFKQSYDEV